MVCRSVRAMLMLEHLSPLGALMDATESVPPRGRWTRQKCLQPRPQVNREGERDRGRGETATSRGRERTYSSFRVFKGLSKEMELERGLSPEAACLDTHTHTYTHTHTHTHTDTHRCIHTRTPNSIWAQLRLKDHTRFELGGVRVCLRRSVCLCGGVCVRVKKCVGMMTSRRVAFQPQHGGL